ncbi:MAG: HD domain-containing protein [Clostridia bacterium]|nr:HD domain-containing protein [Clostridia bacterium]
MPFKMQIAPEAQIVIDALEQVGFEAYLVGGAVRDAIYGKSSDDSDVCTNAFPEEMQKVFEGFRCIPTGLKHGTLTVLTEYGAVEVTTYRVDGTYTDHRRPDSVFFTRSLEEDLARRDLTINAMAYSPKTGLFDPFGGQTDLENKIIRAVGDPMRRFTEDALRILRALRFAARLGGTIEEETKKAIFSLKKDLSFVAKERIREELLKLLVTDGAVDILLSFAEVFCRIIPELSDCVDCTQNNPHHQYSVYEHMVHSVGYAPKVADVRMAMLLHDIAKPKVKRTDEKGIDHFYGHDRKSAQMAEEILKELRFDHHTKNRIVTWILYHDIFREYSMSVLRRRAGKIGAENMEGMFQVCRADIMAQSAYKREEKLRTVDAFEAGWEKAKSAQLAYRVSDLNIGGRQLMAMGLSGPSVGALLEKLLNEVIDEKVANEKEALEKRAMQIIEKKGQA